MAMIKPTRDVWHGGHWVPADYSIEVSDAALPSYLADGWVVADEEPQQDEPEETEDQEG